MDCSRDHSLKMDKFIDASLQASSKKVFIFKLIVQEIGNQMNEIIGCVETTATQELEFLVDLFLKYEKKPEEALLGDKLLVQAEVDKLTEMMEKKFFSVPKNDFFW